MEMVYEMNEKDNTKKIKRNTIYNLDCKKIISKLIKENIKVDLILTDPPYNISRKNNFKTIGRSGIDFGEWDKGFNQTSWLTGISKITSKNASILIFNDWKNFGDISKKLEKEGFEVKDIIRWIKPNPMPRNTNRRYVTDFEFIIWAVKKGGKWTFNKNSFLYSRPEYRCTVPSGSKRFHPTQKPIKLIKELIETHSNKGDLIFDPFSGSGAISLAAFETDRYFISCEIDEKYWNESLKLLKSHLIKPAFNHIGNKLRMIDELIRIFPKKNIKYFVEPFAGSGIVSISYQSAEKYFLNDNDKFLSEILEYLFNTKKSIIIEEIEKIIKKYNLPVNEKRNYKEEYNKLRDEFNKTKKTHLLFVLILYGFNQQIRFNSNNEFNIPAGKFFWSEYHKEKIKNFIQNKTNKNYSISNRDFEEFVNWTLDINGEKNILFYFDPPYLISNATYNYSWNENDEMRLLNCIKKLNSKKIPWVLSNVIVSKGNENLLLKKFIEENKINFEYVDSINYSNSNYNRKRNIEDKDVEILLWGNLDG